MSSPIPSGAVLMAGQSLRDPLALFRKVHFSHFKYNMKRTASDWLRRMIPIPRSRTQSQQGQAVTRFRCSGSADRRSGPKRESASRGMGITNHLIKIIDDSYAKVKGD